MSEWPTVIAVGLEERERLEHLIVKDFKNDAKGHRERLMQGHRVRGMLQQLQQQADKSVSYLTQRMLNVTARTVVVSIQIAPLSLTAYTFSLRSSYEYNPDS